VTCMDRQSQQMVRVHVKGGTSRYVIVFWKANQESRPCMQAFNKEGVQGLLGTCVVCKKQWMGVQSRTKEELWHV
jgi:hypothetical protein